MTGPHESILGRRVERVLEATISLVPTHFDVATNDVRLNGSIVEIDRITGKASSIRRLCIRQSELGPAGELPRLADD